MKTRHKIGLAVAAVASIAIVAAHSGKAGPQDLYPTAATPGVTNPNVTQENIQSTICVSGWTATIRPSASYTTALKKQQLPDGSNLANYEEDHFISLELGGNPTQPANLWPEPYQSSLAGIGAHTKDQVENYLHKQVCAGAMTLAEAQQEITTDWYSVFIHKLAETMGGIVNATGTVDPDDEN